MEKFHRGCGYIGGVCEGLGNYFNIDPLIIRLIFAVGHHISPVFLMLYIFIWLFTDEEEWI